MANALKSQAGKPDLSRQTRPAVYRPDPALGGVLKGQAHHMAAGACHASRGKPGRQKLRHISHEAIAGRGRINRAGLDHSGALITGMNDRRLKQGCTDPLPTQCMRHEEAGDRPDRAGFGIMSANRPQAFARANCTPADRNRAAIGQQTRRDATGPLLPTSWPCGRLCAPRLAPLLRPWAWPARPCTSTDPARPAPRTGRQGR